MTARRRSRVEDRPRPADWADDAPMTLEEYVAVFSGVHPLTVSTLRTEIRHQRLTPAIVGGRYFVTPAQIRALFRPSECQGKRKGPASSSSKGAETTAPESLSPTSGSSEMERKRRAQAALTMALGGLQAPPNEPSPLTSPRSGPRRLQPSTKPNGAVIPLRSTSTKS